ncbi:MAG: hypothetical protein ACKOXB_02260 [Flavobacteriales bacterium]
MTFRQKYSKLQDEEFVAKMVVDSAYANMWLEDQAIAKDKVKTLYNSLMKNKKKAA